MLASLPDELVLEYWRWWTKYMTTIRTPVPEKAAAIQRVLIPLTNILQKQKKMNAKITTKEEVLTAFH